MEFFKTIEQLLNEINGIVWGPPLLILLVGTGIYFTFKLKLLQIFKLPLAIKYLFSKIIASALLLFNNEIISSSVLLRPPSPPMVEL